MKLRALLDENPEARDEYQAALTGAQETGVKVERDRVCAHLAHIGHSKDVVVKAITEGGEFGHATMSTYMLAATKTAQGSARAGDNPDALNTAEGDEAEAAAAAAQAGGDAAFAAAFGKGIDSALDAADSGSIY